MDIEEIIQACEYSAKELNFKALVLQSGEDFWYDKAKLVKIVEGVIKKSPLLLILSIGDRDIETYRQLYDLRFETSNQELYEKYKPGYKLGDRLELIRALKEIGYLVFTGFLIGLPGQTEQDLLNDIELIGSLNPDMFSFGPFIPHPNTPLKDALRPSPDSVFKIIARTRIKYPDSRILVTTALQTLDKENGARLGFLSGANSMMINLTPDKYLQLYEIYPLRAGTDQKVTQRIEQTIEFLHSIGRAPTDLGL
jgi:biotin synthase